mmetsp:Transcript_11745/g.33060  ORF Transcript_11745/g.33060 Transcript_11745/m.33060 type:complete len:232 (-) Transcript_11745:4168-4863(-)
MAPQPSPRRNPFASLSKVLHAPSTDSMRALQKDTNTSARSSVLTPATSAPSQLPPRMACWARHSATSAEEQAVSIPMLGPLRSNAYDTRPAATECVVAVQSYGDDEPCSTVIACQSMLPIPTNTPSDRPRSVALFSPAELNAPYAASSTMRCCTSMATASAGGTPNALQSNHSAWSMKQPRATYISLGCRDCVSGLKYRSASKRDRGTSVAANRPSARKSQSEGRSPHPPG